MGQCCESIKKTYKNEEDVGNQRQNRDIHYQIQHRDFGNQQRIDDFHYQQQNWDFGNQRQNRITRQPQLSDGNANYEQNERRDQSDNLPNVLFYQNKIPARPNNEKIETILRDWPGNFIKLESNHQYIQWLFPNRQPGLNSYAHPLKDQEAAMIRNSSEMKGRVRRAFVMMLDFYGMKLTEDDQFELTENSDIRLNEINTWGNHNFLRISRILLALKDLGHKHLVLPWLRFLADLIFKEKKLNQAEKSFQQFWIETAEYEDQESLMAYVVELVPREY